MLEEDELDTILIRLKQSYEKDPTPKSEFNKQLWMYLHIKKMIQDVQEEWRELKQTE